MGLRALPFQTPETREAPYPGFLHTLQNTPEWVGEVGCGLGWVGCGLVGVVVWGGVWSGEVRWGVVRWGVVWVDGWVGGWVGGPGVF